MITFLTDWPTAWLMTGIGVGVVFLILVLLVLVLSIFGKFISMTDTPAKAPAAPAAQPVAEASEDDKAAVAVALYLYQNDMHDEESGVLTINETNSAWHAVLNTRL